MLLPSWLVVGRAPSLAWGNEFQAFASGSTSDYKMGLRIPFLPASWVCGEGHKKHLRWCDW